MDQGAHLIHGDALDAESVQSAVDKAKEAGEGAIAGVAHLVGSLVIRPPHALALDAFNEVVHTNLSSAFLTLSVACKTMLRSGGGRLVFTSSVAATLGLMNHEAIAAAKGGVEAMVRSAAATYSQRSIRLKRGRTRSYGDKVGSNFASFRRNEGSGGKQNPLSRESIRNKR